MKFYQLTPGSGNQFYCENCLRDAVMIHELRRLGHDAVTVPLYLPITLNEPVENQQAPLFLGGINVFLQQKYNFFRRYSPRWLDQWLDSPRLLKKLSGMSRATDAHQLAAMTISMLKGSHGSQAKEMTRLIAWLQQEQPDVVCLSNALLSGLAPLVKKELSCRVICLLQDEDEFIDVMPGDYPQHIWQLIAENLCHADGCVAVSQFYHELMRTKLPGIADKITALSPGVTLPDERMIDPSPREPIIGYLSRMCEEKGLADLVEAVITLRKQKRFENLTIWAAGGRAGVDEPFVKGISERLIHTRNIGALRFVPGFDYEQRASFFNTISLLCVPEKRQPAYARYVLESLSFAVPVAAPCHGVFPEIAEKTQGVTLYDPRSPWALHDTLQDMLCDNEAAMALGKQGRQGLAQHFDLSRCTEQFADYAAQLM